MSCVMYLLLILTILFLLFIVLHEDTSYTLYPITSPVVHFSEPATEELTRNGICNSPLT